MSDADGKRHGNEGGSRIVTNRTAVAIAAASVVLAVALWVVVRRGLLGDLIVYAVAIDTLPLVLLFVLTAGWLVVWSWGRLVSLLQ